MQYSVVDNFITYNLAEILYKLRMSELNETQIVGDHQDSWLDMVVRREISNYAKNPRDLNIDGLILARHFVTITEEDSILDVGCSSGKFFVEAAEAAGIKSHLIGLEPIVDLADYLFTQADTSKFQFVPGYGENIPLPDNSVKISTGHNVLFRSPDPMQMLREMQRVTEPGGVIVISTNGKRHAFWRHWYSKAVALDVSEQLGVELTPPSTPAAGFFLESVPDLVQDVKGLEVAKLDTQRDESIITRGIRFKKYLDAIELSANRTNIQPEHRGLWRESVRKIVSPMVMGNIILEEELLAANPDMDFTPAFRDEIDRGIFVIRNNK